MEKTTDHCRAGDVLLQNTVKNEVELSVSSKQHS